LAAPLPVVLATLARGGESLMVDIKRDA